MRESSRERRQRRMSLEGENEQGEKLIVGAGVSRITASTRGGHGLFGDSDNDKIAGQSEMKKETGERIERRSRRDTAAAITMDAGSSRGIFPKAGTGSSVNEKTTPLLDSNEFEANEVTIPISTCLSVFFCYILLGSILFSWWEGWEYFEGSYFCFVSLVTIGFSDMVPGQGRTSKSSSAVAHVLVGDAETATIDDHHHGVVDGGGSGGGGERTSAAGSNGREESLDHVDGQLILCSIYILFGMALMAMCFHLTQERFFTTAKKLGRALHLI